MSEVRTRNQRLVLRFLVAQICCAAAIAVGGLFYAGWAVAHAVLAGGVIVAVGNAVFGWRLFAPGVATVRVLARGLFAGVSIDGSLISSRSDWNQEYYGKPMAAQQIVINGQGSNPGADPLREILSRYSGG